jgi:hypothetical protein
MQAAAERQRTKTDDRENGCLEALCRFFGMRGFRAPRWRVAAYHVRVGAGERHGLTVLDITRRRFPQCEICDLETAATL